MYQCKMKPEELSLCFMKVADTSGCKCGAQPCTSLAFNTCHCTLGVIILHL